MNRDGARADETATVSAAPVAGPVGMSPDAAALLSEQARAAAEGRDFEMPVCDAKGPFGPRFRCAEGLHHSGDHQFHGQGFRAAWKEGASGNDD